MQPKNLPKEKLQTTSSRRSKSSEPSTTWPHVWQKTANLAYSVATNNLNWEARCQGRPPIHLAVLAVLLAIIGLKSIHNAHGT